MKKEVCKSKLCNTSHRTLLPILFATEFGSICIFTTFCSWKLPELNQNYQTLSSMHNMVDP